MPAARVLSGAVAMRSLSAIHTSTSFSRLTAGARWPFSLYMIAVMEVATQVAIEVGTVMMGSAEKTELHLTVSIHFPPPMPTKTVAFSFNAVSAYCFARATVHSPLNSIIWHSISGEMSRSPVMG